MDDKNATTQTTTPPCTALTTTPPRQEDLDRALGRVTTTPPYRHPVTLADHLNEAENLTRLAAYAAHSKHFGNAFNLAGQAKVAIERAIEILVTAIGLRIEGKGDAGVGQ